MSSTYQILLNPARLLTHLSKFVLLYCVNIKDKKLIRRWDSERERFTTTSSTTFTQFTSEATEFGKITQNKGRYAVQGHSRSPILVPIESSYTTSY